jgi:hypothetical protein
MPAAAPPPPPRRTRRAGCYLVPIGEAFACADSGRFGVLPRRRRSWAAERYPSLFVTVRSAPPTSSATADLVQPLAAAQCSAVHLPDGAGAIGYSRRTNNAAGRADGGRAHP